MPKQGWVGGGDNCEYYEERRALKTIFKELFNNIYISKVQAF